MSRVSGRQRGSTMVEFALTVSLLLLMLFGVVDFGRALYAYHFVDHAAKEAARYGAVHGYTCNIDNSCSIANPDTGPADSNNTVIQDFVTSIVPPGIDTSSNGCGGSACLTVSPSWPVQGSPDQSPAVCNKAVDDGLGGTGPHENFPGCTIQVQVQYQFKFLVPIVSKSAVTLTGTSEMVIAH
jgi:Flp pilus assembly protein TadG